MIHLPIQMIPIAGRVPFVGRPSGNITSIGTGRRFKALVDFYVCPEIDVGEARVEGRG
jgi:hypothetical protein